MLKSLTRRNIFVSFNTKHLANACPNKKKGLFQNRVNLLYNLEEDRVNLFLSSRKQSKIRSSKNHLVANFNLDL